MNESFLPQILATCSGCGKKYKKFVFCDKKARMCAPCANKHDGILTEDDEDSEEARGGEQ